MEEFYYFNARLKFSFFLVYTLYKFIFIFFNEVTISFFILYPLIEQYNNITFLKSFSKCALQIFHSLKAHCFWLGITCYILATQGQGLPGADGVWTPDTQIPSLMPRQSATAIYTMHSIQVLLFISFSWYFNNVQFVSHSCKTHFKKGSHLVSHFHTLLM